MTWWSRYLTAAGAVATGQVLGLALRYAVDTYGWRVRMYYELAKDLLRPPPWM